MVCYWTFLSECYGVLLPDFTGIILILVGFGFWIAGVLSVIAAFLHFFTFLPFLFPV